MVKKNVSNATTYVKNKEENYIIARKNKKENVQRGSQYQEPNKNVSNATTYVKNKKKTLYIKVRPYQTINKKNVYGRWSYLQL